MFQKHSEMFYIWMAWYIWQVMKFISSRVFSCENLCKDWVTKISMLQGVLARLSATCPLGWDGRWQGCPAEKGKVSAPTQSDASLQQRIQLTNYSQFWRPEAQRFRLASPFWLLTWLHQKKPENMTNCFICLHVTLKPLTS